MSFINTLEALLDNWTEFCKLASGYKMYENWVSTITSKEQSPWDIGVNSEAFTGSRCPHRRQLDTCGEGECGGGTSFKIRDVGHSKERYDTGRVAITWYVTLSHCHTVTLSHCHTSHCQHHHHWPASCSPGKVWSIVVKDEQIIWASLLS